MKIGVISDTHIPKAAVDLPEAVYNDFVDCELILHAGDLVEIDVLNKLERLAPVRAVQGNMDMRNVKDLLPKKDIIEAGKFKIGLIHGYGNPHGLIKAVKSEFKNGIDVIVFGHAHTPTNEKIGKTLFFNPGSPTDTVFAPYNSYGVLEVNDTIEGRIIRI
ncbi:MAG: metallophosphoesterase family protein [Candidatus Omnitrophica bacterium]|nr:metallophosphoesterase family protein [Candidatus Omnitrophota bacterium]